ncbi:hypothetical protein ACFX14_026363 [Malus domestica]
MAASLPIRTPKANEGGRTTHLERVMAENVGADHLEAPTADDRVTPTRVTEADTCLHEEAPESGTLGSPWRWHAERR